MKVVKFMLAINGVTLVINGIIVWLTIIKAFPAALAFVVVFVFIGGATWLSCYANGALPKRRRRSNFYSAKTERMEHV